ncbi:hypothetical protein GIB67_002455 [Kingdonia uniflora]|uniref:RING-type domain-containing protein n=1 Tax=Kingdonia uniflora TaxID=39325 RepID=A0A7J7P181_9MAGN|nr:hypothetical protein GIB67_006628 [Kingdonia uniflora]KAF6173063.1 hypothetical protein GIB67_002455 [Kingdonia uniflora]
MAVPLLEPHREDQTEKYNLLMEHQDNETREHVIDIVRSGDVSSVSSSDPPPPPIANLPEQNVRPSTSTLAPISQSFPTSENVPSLRNASVRRRRDGYVRRRSPLNSTLWISIELIATVSQIITSVVVLSLSRHENPQAPLFAWAIGYASGCVATLPVLCWRFLHRNNQGTQQDSAQPHQDSSRNSPPPESTSYRAVSARRTPVVGDIRNTITATRNGQNVESSTTRRVNMLVDHYKMGLDCFFAVWFVVGNVWIFGGHSTSSEAPNLYRLCLVFLTFSCIGYAMPFILCATICCCLPCIISVLGFREDPNHTRGATPESITALPTYKFKLKKKSNRGEEVLSGAPGDGEGLLAAGTEKERAISGEDAVCCICLAKYADNEELRELPCTHFFHMECVDKWLKISALCPLCKSEVGVRAVDSPFTVRTRGRDENRGEFAGGDAYGTTVF